MIDSRTHLKNKLTVLFTKTASINKKADFKELFQDSMLTIGGGVLGSALGGSAGMKLALRKPGFWNKLVAMPKVPFGLGVGTMVGGAAGSVAGLNTSKLLTRALYKKTTWEKIKDLFN